jgi:hypothetical protein
MADAKPRTSRIPELTDFQAFAWPLTVLLLVFMFWSPLRKLLATLPDALANSETITVGSASLRVGKSLSDQANQDVRDALSGMTAADVTLVAQVPLEGSVSYMGGISSELLGQWERLERLGLVTRESDEELAKQAMLNKQPKAIYGVKATAKYYKVRKFLLGVLTDVVTGAVRDSQPARSGS